MEQIAQPHDSLGDRFVALQRLTQEAQKLFSADFCAVQAVNPLTELLQGDAATAGDLPTGASPEPMQQQLKAFSLRAAEHGGIYAENRERLRNTIRSEPIFKDFTSVVGIPVFTEHQKKPMAVLILGFRRRTGLKKIERRLLRLFTDQWLPILENGWLLYRYREVVSIGQQINQTLQDPGDLFEQLFEKVSHILDTKYFFMLATYNQSDDTVDYHAALEGVLSHSLGQPLSGGCAYVIKGKSALFKIDGSDHWDLVSNLTADQAHPQSLIFVPLTFRDEVLGVLSLQKLEANAFDDKDLAIMTLLANQVALAIHDLRLSGYLRQLNEAGQHLEREISSDSMLDGLVDRIREVTKADIVTLYPYVQNSESHSEQQFADPRVSGQLLESDDRRVQERYITTLALQQQEPIWAMDAGELFALLTGRVQEPSSNFENREQVASTAMLPLWIEGTPVGVLFVNYRHRQDFNATQRNFMRGLANFAAIAIYNNRRFQDLYQHRLAELEAFRQIELDISGSLKLRDVLQAILTRASKTVSADAASIYLFNEHTKQLETEVSFGIHRDNFEQHSVSPDGQGLAPWVFRHQKPVRVDNVKTDPRWKDIYYQFLEYTESQLVVPLLTDQEVLGVISFESSREAAFTESDETFLVTLAGQAVLAIKEARLYEEAEEGRRSLEVLYEVTKEIIAQQGDPEKVIRFILSQARHLIGAEGALFQQYESGRPGEYYVDSSDHETKNLLIQLQDGYALGIVHHVATTKTPYTTIGTDAQDNPYYKGGPSIRSEMAVPLLSEDGELIGVLDLESPRLFAFTESDEHLLALFAELAVVAIKNAREYSRATEEAKRFQLLSQVASKLAEITGPEDLERAYEIVLMTIGEFSAGEALIRRYDPPTQDLILVASARERAVRPVERLTVRDGMNGVVARERRTVVINDLDHSGMRNDQLVGNDPSIKSLAITPLLFEHSYYGNVALSSETSNSLTTADLLLLEGLAKQLAITIHRLEIAEAKIEAEKLGRNLRVMSEVGQSTMEFAHRLGNELGLVRVYAHAIRKELEEQRIDTDSILHRLDEITRSVEGVLKLRKRLAISGADWQERERVVVPVKTLLEELFASVKIPESISVNQSVESNLSVNVVVGQVVDVLRNLLMNAVEAMPDGGTVTVRTTNENLGTTARHLGIEVSDTGPGISESDRTRIFNLFFSRKNSSGFGLWSARQYARANGGDLIYKETASTGATFQLLLPIVVETRDISMGAQIDTSRVLHVEDEQRWREIVGRILKGAGISVDQASSPGEALELLQTKNYDLVLLDLSIVGDPADKTGMQIVQQATESGLLRKAKVIVLSAYVTMEAMREGFSRYGIDDFLDKIEFDQKKFLNLVKSALSPELSNEVEPR